MSAITADPGEVAQRSFREVWVISLGHALTHWYPATFYLLLPLIGKELGLDYAQIGSILTAQYAAGAIANVPGGILVDTIGRKGLLMAISLCWIGIPYLLMGYSHAYWMILGCATLVGIGNNLWHPTAIPWLADRFPSRKGLVMAFHGMGANVGDAVAPLVMGILLQSFNWRTVVVMNVLPGIAVAAFILVYVGRLQMADIRAGIAKAKPHAIGGAQRLRMLGTLVRNRALVTLSIGAAFRSMTQSALLTFLPLYLARVMGYPIGWIGACMFALQAAGFVAAPIAGHFSDKVGRRQIIMSSMSMTAVVIGFMIFAGGTGWFVLLVALLGFFLFAVRAVLQAWLLDSTPPGMGGSAIGMLFGTQASARRSARSAPASSPTISA
jgi:FSR family fosmidomycin resistance protein-like MFS transporter